MQLGDPFAEKLLLEACLEVMTTGAVVGIQDMGAAGLTCSSFEMASSAGTGIEMDLDLVPQREEGMSPYELLLSESQERMLLVAEAGREAEVLDVFSKWDLEAVVVGKVTDTGRMQVRWRRSAVVDIPVDPIARSSPIYDRPVARPADLDERRKLDVAALPPEPDPSGALLDLLRSPNLCSREWILPAVRPDRAVEHRAASGRRRRGDPGSRYEPRPRPLHGLQPALLLAGSPPGSAARGGRGGAQCRGDRRAPVCRHELPQLRESGAAGVDVGVRPRACAEWARPVGRSGFRSSRGT